MLFFTLIFSVIIVSSALKALFLDYNVRMLCEFNPFFAHKICLHGKIHFICLIQIENTEICTAYRKSAKKYRDMIFYSYRPALVL